MNYLSVEQLSKSFNEQALFNDITFGISQGQKVALVGKNGCGKSTLLKIIGGVESPDSGKVVFRKGIKLSFLAQNPKFDNHLTVRDYIFDQDNELLSTVSEYEQFIESENPDITGRRYQELINKMDSLSAWDFESQVKQIVGKLGIHNLDLFVDELSGGQKKRVALAAALVEKPDFLILDEPTNHLDTEVIEWLEKYLSTQTMSLLLVTHDRYFLEEVTNEIIEIDNQTIYTYKGNYSYYLEKKSERQTKEATEVAKAKNLLVKELEWLRRMPKARSTKAKYRIDAAHDLMDVANKDLREDALTLKINTKRQGKKILELHHLTKSFNGEKYIDNFSYIFKRKDRIGIVGKNGVGKTTLLNVITGELKLDSGEAVLGETTQFGYYKQEEISYPAETKVIDVVKEVAEVVKLSDGATITAAQFLNHFLFPHEVHMSPVEKLSGGEKRRLQLLRVLIDAPNFLILDEPTNDLDILTMNVLEDYLLHFEGTLIIVSHDRYFMDKLAGHLFVFGGGGKIFDFPGNYSDYKNHIVPLEKDSTKKNKKAKDKQISKQRTGQKTPSAGKAGKLSYKEKKEFESLEQEIVGLETKKGELINKLNDGSGNHEELMDWSLEIEQLTSRIEEKEYRWLELSERA
ncbi:MAG: ABC-F family ATP-binding cassette domain-containing protein [Cyclobacteriaceae bacterium]|nr:ABC-F family ATP-binding cassette domain-containing protein [Cyclobacteriaceae bacterium]